MPKIHPLLTLFLASLGSTAMAQTASNADEQSLQNLMQVEVSSVAKKPQRLANVAASIFVISAEDIRLSGANSIPEVLRLAPGIDATRLSGNRWAVSARGFADRLANKLLVLIDGRTVYSVAFSGVIWEQVQIPLEDIERIEVVRGPGASVWGSNAVNGVINIITRSAAATQGGQATLGGGTLDGKYGRVGWGSSDPAHDVYYRVYGTAQNAATQRAPYAVGDDTWTNRAAGFRLDGYSGAGTHWDVSTDYAGAKGDSTTVSPRIIRSMFSLPCPFHSVRNCCLTPALSSRSSDRIQPTNSSTHNSIPARCTFNISPSFSIDGSVVIIRRGTGADSLSSD